MKVSADVTFDVCVCVGWWGGGGGQVYKWRSAEVGKPPPATVISPFILPYSTSFCFLVLQMLTTQNSSVVQISVLLSTTTLRVEVYSFFKRWPHLTPKSETPHHSPPPPTLLSSFQPPPFGFWSPLSTFGKSSTLIFMVKF